ncbi:MAG: hypothetical protein ACHQ50_09810 [Fimbriimonadales bacterium]
MQKHNLTRLSLRLVIALAASVAFVAACAQNAAGNWSGHVDFSGAKGKDAQEQKMIDGMKKTFGAAIIKLTMKADKTYHLVFPPVSGMKGQTEDGKWSQKGKAVTMTDPKGKSETATLSSDGKKMVMLPPASDPGPKGLKMVFTRG